MLNSPKNIAILYARVSTEEQAERDYSIPAQIKAIKQFAANNAIQIIKEYIDEGKSAKSADRPEFQQMISDAKKNDKKFSIILVHKTDRFARNRSDCVVYKSLLKKECSVDVISVTENFDDSPTGKLLEGMMEVIAEFHSLNLAQEVMKGMKQKAESGVYLGKAPYGYSLAEDRKLSINPNEAKIVQMIFEMYLNGNSFSMIKSHLNRAGILTGSGCLWDSSSIKRIINNRAYLGEFSWNKYKKSQKKYKDISDWIVKADAHEAIISQEIFARAQDILKSKSFMKGHSCSSPYLLSSMLKCGHCGHNMIGEKKVKPEKTYYRYVCGNHLNHKICFYNYVTKDEIESIILKEVKKICILGKVKLEQISVFESTCNTSEGDLLELQLKKLQDKYIRQLQAYESGVLSLQELKEAKSRVSMEEEEIKLKLNTIDRKKHEDNLNKHIEQYLRGIAELSEANEPKKIKLWLKQHIHSIEVFNCSEVCIKYNISEATSSPRL